MKNDLFKVRAILVIAIVLAIGIYIGVTVEKRNAQTIYKEAR